MSCTKSPTSQILYLHRTPSTFLYHWDPCSRNGLQWVRGNHCRPFPSHGISLCTIVPHRPPSHCHSIVSHGHSSCYPSNVHHSSHHPCSRRPPHHFSYHFSCSLSTCLHCRRFPQPISPLAWLRIHSTIPSLIIREWWGYWVIRVC